ncbi:hypothetical protein IEQ44_00060 [Nocardioides sp. Y6]|uniref:Uncharacterized protein n=1 Tax=Nocardioides malaquae TaxID=2773426 RepID=A0ABR9RN87_9ACTN|nr:hypothetical protein [Nocardioides malaquae]MBE7323041.1 hypothetical protein [Nocardioides malaquae]
MESPTTSTVASSAARPCASPAAGTDAGTVAAAPTGPIAVAHRAAVALHPVLPRLLLLHPLRPCLLLLCRVLLPRLSMLVIEAERRLRRNTVGPRPV